MNKLDRKYDIICENEDGQSCESVDSYWIHIWINSNYDFSINLSDFNKMSPCTGTYCWSLESDTLNDATTFLWQKKLQ